MKNALFLFRSGGIENASSVVSGKVNSLEGLKLNYVLLQQKNGTTKIKLPLSITSILTSFLE